MRPRPVPARRLFPFLVGEMGTMPCLFPSAVSSASSFVASSRCRSFRFPFRYPSRGISFRLSPRRSVAVASPSRFSFRVPSRGRSVPSRFSSRRPCRGAGPVVGASDGERSGESAVFGSSSCLSAFVNRACLSTFYILSTFCIFCSLSIFYILRYTIQ